MRRWRGRAFAIGGLAAGVAAALVAVLAALAAPTATLSQAQAADATTSLERHAGRVCFTVGGVTSSRTCVPKVRATDIRYVTTVSAIGGVAGSSVRAVIVKLTKKGTVWATLQNGAFFAAVPAGHRVRAVVKVLADGRRRSFPVR